MKWWEWQSLVGRTKKWRPVVNDRSIWSTRTDCLEAIIKIIVLFSKSKDLRLHFISFHFADVTPSEWFQLVGNWTFTELVRCGNLNSVINSSLSFFSFVVVVRLDEWLTFSSSQWRNRHRATPSLIWRKHRDHCPPLLSLSLPSISLTWARRIDWISDAFFTAFSS